MSRSETIGKAVLIVEDESLIRMGAISPIEDAGFIVYEAASADEAISLLERHREIRLIFTDIHMPGSMDGLKLAHYVRGRWPPVKIIVTSGQMKPRGEDLPSDAVFIGKPYRSEVIAQKISEMLAEAA
jgi:two-component system, response regulator PdtaR